MYFESIYHPVGQGLFHSTKIDDALFIYDCGSNSKEDLESCIDTLLSRHSKPKIDMLIISHFHEDHINGIEYLLDKADIDTIVLPYIDDVEKAFLMIMKGYGRNPITAPIFINPIWYFLGVEAPKVKRIILIGQGKASSGLENDRPIPTVNDNNNDDMIDISQMREDKELKMKLNKNSFYKEMIEGGQLIVLKHDGSLFFKSTWELKFFNLEIESSILKKFIENLKGNLNFSDFNILKQQIKKDEVREKLRKCYGKYLKKEGSKFNDTSLVVYHAPYVTNYQEFQLKMMVKEYTLSYFNKYFNYIFYLKDEIFGQLLLGDIKLNRSNYSELKTHYERKSDNIKVILLSHHGSEHNWNSLLLVDYKNAEVYVSSSGFSNSYGHPSLKVAREIDSMHKCFVNGNETIRCSINGYH